jgi:hypothetical protein
LIPSTAEAAIRFFSRLLVAAYLIEAGVLLVLAPWSALWDRNYFAAMFPALGAWMASPYVKGAVSGIGVVTALGGLRDLVSAFMSRHPQPDPDTPR